MSERIANVAEFKAVKDDGKPFLGNGGSVGKHVTYPPSLDLAYANEERLPLFIEHYRTDNIGKDKIVS